MFLVSGVNDFMSMFVSLELVTLSFFILAAFRRHDRLSGEAGIKYIVIGALAAGIMLFGMAFIYGATGKLRFAEVAAALDGLDTVIVAHGLLGDQERSQSSYAEAELVFRTNLLSAVSMLTGVAQRFEAQGQASLLAEQSGQRLAILAIVVFLVAGMAILLTVDEHRGRAEAQLSESRAAV